MKNWIFCVILLAGCNNNQQSLKEKQGQVENGSIDKSYSYECKELGWKTTLPKNWNLLTKKESDKINEKGQQEIEKSIGKKVDVTGLKELINLKKDIYNTFLSTMEAFDEKNDGTYEEKNKEVIQLIGDTYKSKGIHFDMKEGSEKIDGLDFNTVHVVIYTPGSDAKVLMNQIMYNRLLNGKDFSMTMNYNNPVDSTTQANIIHHSTFSVRN